MDIYAVGVQCFHDECVDPHDTVEMVTVHLGEAQAYAAELHQSYTNDPPPYVLEYRMTYVVKLESGVKIEEGLCNEDQLSVWYSEGEEGAGAGHIHWDANYMAADE